MPRQARIDAPGAVHHIIVRGIERRAIFADDSDRTNFLDRFGRLLTGYAVSFNRRHRRHGHLFLPEPEAL